MDREALLKSLGLTSEQFDDLIAQFISFQSRLDEAQLAVVYRSLPTLEQACASLGPAPEDLAELFRTETPTKDVMQFYFLGESGDGNNGTT